MSDDDIQKSLALLDACISVLGPSSNRILPYRAFVKQVKPIAAFLQEQNYVFVSATKRTFVSPQYKNLAGLKKFIETEFQTTRTIPPLALVDEKTKKERDKSGNFARDARRGRPPNQSGQAASKSRQKSLTRTKRPSTKFTATSVLTPSNKSLYSSDSEHESTRSFTLIKQSFGPMTGNSIDDRYYMGVVRLFGVNLPIPVGTIVWPIEVKMELEDEDNNDNNEDINEDKNSSASYKSQNNSPEMSADFESIEEFSEDLNAMPEDEELLSSGSM